LVEAFGPAQAMDEPVAAQAALPRAKHPALRIPDALVIAIGIVGEADAILTADRRWADIDPRVAVVG
jgi:predicted nucleic acid-binding protein